MGDLRNSGMGTGVYPAEAGEAMSASDFHLKIVQVWSGATFQYR